MARATHKLAKQVGLLGHFAEVTLSANFSDRMSILVAPNAIGAGPDNARDCWAAHSGAAFAIGHIRGHSAVVAADIVIESIRTIPCDSRPIDIAYAACRAVWAALGVEGCELPEPPAGIPLETWSVHRQDDNGNRFLMHSSVTQQEAVWLVATYDARGHKQLYWAERNA